MVKSDTVFIIILFIITVISVVFAALPVLTGETKSKCITYQYDYFNNMDSLMDFARQKGVTYTNYTFKVIYCTECIWFDPANSRWVIKFVKDKKLAYRFNVSQVLDVPTGCSDCGIKCTNMTKDMEFNFEIGKDYVKCTNCL